MATKLQEVCDNIGCKSEYAEEVLAKLKNDECVRVEDYTEFLMVKAIAKTEKLKVRYKEITGRVVVHKSFSSFAPLLNRR